MRKKPQELGGLEWGKLGLHCWEHGLGVRLFWASQDQELEETSCTVVEGPPSPWVVWRRRGQTQSRSSFLSA